MSELRGSKSSMNSGTLGNRSNVNSELLLLGRSTGKSEILKLQP